MMTGVEGAAVELLQIRRTIINANWAAALASRSTDSNSSAGGSADSIYYSVPANLLQKSALQGGLPDAGAESPAGTKLQQPAQQDATGVNQQKLQDGLQDGIQPMQQADEVAGQMLRPDHWSDMHQELGMQTFVAVPVSDAAGGVVGVLELGSMQQDAFSEEW